MNSNGVNSRKEKTDPIHLVFLFNIHYTSENNFYDIHKDHSQARIVNEKYFCDSL